MTKKIKIEAIIELVGDSFVDEAMLKRTIAPLGDIVSCNVINDYDTQKTTVNESRASSSSNSSVSEISHFINDANKIYFGTLSIDERKYVAASILYTCIADKVKSDQDCKQKLSKSFIEKFEIDPNYVEELLNFEKDSTAISSLKEKFLEGDLIQMYTYIWEKVL